LYNWRISKYNPIYRDEQGNFLKDEWTSFSDIDDLKLSINEYVLTENSYVNAVIAFMEDVGIPSLEVVDLEKYNNNIDIGQKFIDLYPNQMIYLFNSIRNGYRLDNRDVDSLCRLVLRDHLWCKLRYNSSMFVHFGFDYYLYIVTSSPCEKAIEKITCSGLFVEPFESPYM
jgi:hypothetical protein